MSRMDQAKMAMRANKIKKEIEKHVSVAEAGNGAVRAEVTGELKLRKIHIDPKQVDLDDIGQLERWVEEAVKEATRESQKFAEEKAQPLMGMLSSLGF